MNLHFVHNVPKFSLVCCPKMAVHLYPPQSNKAIKTITIKSTSFKAVMGQMELSNEYISSIENYDASGNIIEIFRINNQEKNLFQSYEYDSDNNLLKILHFDTTGELKRVTFYLITEFDSVGKIQRKDEGAYFPQDDTEFMDYTYSYEYDSSGKLLVENRYTIYSPISSSLDQKTLYGDYGNKEKTIRYEGDTVTRETEYTYNQHNDLILEEQIFPQNNRKMECSYDYDSHSNWIKSLCIKYIKDLELDKWQPDFRTSLQLERAIEYF